MFDNDRISKIRKDLKEIAANFKSNVKLSGGFDWSKFKVTVEKNFENDEDMLTIYFRFQKYDNSIISEEDLDSDELVSQLAAYKSWLHTLYDKDGFDWFTGPILVESDGWYFGIELHWIAERFIKGEIVKVNEDWLDPGEDPDTEYVVNYCYDNKVGVKTLRGATGVRGVFEWATKMVYSVGYDPTKLW